MEELIKKLYEEIYGPKVRPQDLLQNLKLDNYYDVIFNKQDDFLLARVFCDLATGEKAEFEYIFVDDKLESLTQVSPTIPQNILYHRETEINKLRNKIKNMLTTRSSISA